MISIKTTFRKLLTRLAGDFVVVGLKNITKQFGIMIISFCAVFICTLFLNFNMDFATVEEQINSPQIMALYDAMVMTGQVVSAVSGGCLLFTSVIMLFFYIKHYIDVHRRNLGILKALGYSNIKIAKNFWVFGLSIFIGTLLGFFSSFLLMPAFYEVQSNGDLLPEIPISFHIELFLALVILPSVIFAVLSVLYSLIMLKQPALQLLTSKGKTKDKIKKLKNKTDKNLPFITELKKSTVKSRASLVFFIIFASFCYSAMTQMSFSMDELASEMFSFMTITIGLVLSFTTLFLGITTVVNSNTKTIAMMQVFGYSYKDCKNSILNGYRPLAYIGFAIGTVYQFVLLKITVSVVFKDVANIPEYNFDFVTFTFSLVTFIIVYEFIIYFYSLRIKHISIKEIMLEN